MEKTKTKIQYRAEDKIEIMALQQQLRAAQAIIKTLTRRLAEMEFKTDKKGGDL